MEYLKDLQHVLAHVLGHIKLTGTTTYQTFNMDEFNGKFYINPESLYQSNGMYKACGKYKSVKFGEYNGEYGVIPIDNPAPETNNYSAYTGKNGLDSYDKHIVGAKDSLKLYEYTGDIDIDKIAYKYNI